MRILSKNSILYDFAPELVKEWHPSANGALTPRTVNINHPVKVWWICDQSHEWQATIETRLNGGICPLCGPDGETVNLQHNSRALDSKEKPAGSLVAHHPSLTAFESDEPDENLGHDFRKSRRFMIRTTAVLENPATGYWYYADAKNFSAGGICFESEAPVIPGTRLVIKLDRPLFNTNRKQFISVVRWCRKQDDEEKKFAGYIMGAVFI